MVTKKDFAPGFKFLLGFAFLIIVALASYVIWYYSLTKNTSSELLKIKQLLLTNNIQSTWQKHYISGFPYRIEINFVNLNLIYLNTYINIKDSKIVFQPWNKKHIILISDKIKIQNKQKNSKNIILEDIKASYNYRKNSFTRISINTKKTRVVINNKHHNLKNSEIHYRQFEHPNGQFFIKIDDWVSPKESIFNEPINSIILEGDLINVKKININNLYDWIKTDGGIDFKNLSFNLNNTTINGQGFLGIDYNDNFLGSFVFHYKKLSKIFKKLEDNNIISNQTYKALSIITEATEALAKLNNKIPSIAINMQDGFLNIYGIKIIKLPKSNKFINFNPV